MRSQPRSSLVSSRTVETYGVRSSTSAASVPCRVCRPVEGEHAFGGVAVELDIDAGERDVPAGDVGLGLEREAAEAAAGGRGCSAQRSVSRSEAASAASVPSILSVGRWLM